MKSAAGAFVALVVGLIATFVLPVFPRRSMTRSSMSVGGDRISWNWELERLPTFFENMRYMRPEEHATLNLMANLVLALGVAFGFGIATWLLWQRFVGGRS